MDLKLTHKLVIVTGSTGDGIGKHIAEELFRQGAYVVINGRSQARVEETIAEIYKDNKPEEDGSKATPARMIADETAVIPRLIGVPGDVSTSEGAEKFIECIQAVETKVGVPVYGLVNNVGIFEAKDFVDVSDDKWMDYYQTNTMSGVRLSRYFLPLMKDRNEGRILFISSESALKPLPHMLPYSVSKTSQLALARGLAEMTKGTKVTVNSIVPGPTMTGGVQQYMQEYAQMNNIDNMEDAVKRYFQDAEPTSLLQRFLDPKEVAAVTVFTLSPLAAGVNGHCQFVDGGLVRHI